MFKTGDILVNGNFCVEVIDVRYRTYTVRNAGLTEERWEGEFPKENVHKFWKQVKKPKRL